MRELFVTMSDSAKRDTAFQARLLRLQRKQEALEKKLQAQAKKANGGNKR